MGVGHVGYTRRDTERSPPSLDGEPALRSSSVVRPRLDPAAGSGRAARPEVRPVPLRIALLAEYYRPRLGGVEVFVADLAERLAAGGHQVHVLTTTPADADGQGRRVPSVEEAEGSGVAVERIPTWFVPGVGVPLHPALPFRFEAALRRVAPDVVHAHASISSAGALAGGYAALRLGLPGVVTIHSRLGGHAWVHRLAHGWTGWGAWARVVAGPSRDVADEVGRTIERRATVLPNGVDVAWWRSARPAPPPAAGRPLRLVTVQRLKGKKRGAALLEVVAALRDRLPPGRPVSLTVVGDGPRRAALEARARRLGLDVAFLGAVPRAGVRAALAEAHVFVLACATEAFGIAAAEARAVGLPVVAYRTGALPDLVPEGRSGILVDHDAGMVRALRRLATEAGLLERLTEQSRAEPPPFDWPEVVRLHEDAYRAALAGASDASPSGTGSEASRPGDSAS